MQSHILNKQDKQLFFSNIKLLKLPSTALVRRSSWRMDMTDRHENDVDEIIIINSPH